MIGNKNNLKTAIMEAYRLDKEQRAYVQIAYNIEKINTKYNYLISPVLTTKINNRKIEIPRVLSKNKYM
jgi:hypothetical protein